LKRTAHQLSVERDIEYLLLAASTAIGHSSGLRPEARSAHVEPGRELKPGGKMAFTFHHSGESAWRHIEDALVFDHRALLEAAKVQNDTWQRTRIPQAA
jgi:hypothetical protein